MRPNPPMPNWLLACLAACLLAAWPPPAAGTDGAAAHQPPAVMLPMVLEDGTGIDVSQYLVSEKLDGVRGRWDGHRLWTRGGLPVAAPAWFTAGWPPVPMDGELWIGRGQFEAASSIVRGAPGNDAEWRRMRFMVFDLPDDGAVFAQRARRIGELTASAGVPWLRAVEQFEVPDRIALDARLAATAAAGGEGLVLHRRDAHYRAGRSGDLLKYKPYRDAEACVVGHTPGRGKYAGMLGALVVERDDGLRFRIGTGFSDAQRADPPPPGSVVTYRYNGLGSNGVPRFARFLHVRHLLPPPVNPPGAGAPRTPRPCRERPR
ncbi:DNA ligase [Luteimonas sp. 8-5]|uniref:DNA ligase n=1 Tax=Luteimonas sp. 8-5 TaxID=3039387 RepID=UPI002436E38D|nr:DNA ligase [Luteimonas sp. 8-5]MDG6348082.1 DNA ligase [Luteimonas sp. 8-5]